MKTLKVGGVSGRRSLFIWGLFCVTAGVVFLAYTLASLAAGRGEFVMPLDDVYIHFQYARQLAAGQPYVYNPGLAPSSGATSFLYPYILAIGYLIGFQGLNLGLWAMGVGALALIGSMWLVYRMVRFYGGREWLAVGVALVFGVTGPVSWHFMSGMETGLGMLFTLGVVDAVGRVFGAKEITPPQPSPNMGREKIALPAVLWATLAAMIRPEVGLLAILAVGAVGIGLWRKRRELPLQKRVWVWLAVPVLAIGVQPLVNLMMTGSAVASGNAAKSIFGTIPFYWGDVFRRVLENWGRMWLEFGTGISPREGVYVMPLLLMLAVGGVVWLLAQRERRWVGLVVLGWLVGGTLMIATLDTAFWHFKRYQMPFMALLFPLAAISLEKFAISKARVEARLRIAVVGVMAIVGVWTAGQFLHHYALNVDYVYLQPLQMARWLQTNTPADAVVAVHDTGMMGYMGGRTTIDMVGLTTAGAADYWRNGPGSVAEYLIDKHPDYVAAYGPGHGLGLGMIADTPVYGNLLASFPVVLDDRYNVALAADFQGIYDSFIFEPGVTYAKYVMQPMTFQINFSNSSYDEVDQINVADIASETSHQYQWRDSPPSPGFPTEVYEMRYTYCFRFVDDQCNMLDAGRRINGEEAFTLMTEPGKDLVLVTRIHPFNAVNFDVYANDVLVTSRYTPALPGRWMDINVLIPAHYVVGNQTRIRIVPHVTAGFYMPYYHWAIQGDYLPDAAAEKPLAVFQDGAIVLNAAKLDYDAVAKTVGVTLGWYTDGRAEGDYKEFVHLYRDTTQPPVAQTDEYPMKDSSPPGSWMPGAQPGFPIVVDLKEIPPGKYQVAIGLYNPYTNERLQPTGGDDQGRLFIGEVDIQ